jgi:sugar phosphate isomerase/epimerase
MKIQFFCPRWGSDLNWDAFMQKVKAAGYDGIEYGIANEAPREEIAEVLELAKQHGLLIIAQHYGTYDADFNTHYNNYTAWFQKIKRFDFARVNSQTGKDFFSFDEVKFLLAVADDYSKSTGIPVSHETHRNKFTFAAHITKDYLNRIPGLKLTLDISHWICVAETYLEDQQQAVELAIARTEHIHARVGYPEGPQVPDPRIDEWQHSVNTHLAWWDKVIERRRTEGQPTFTICPEFGPAPYMVPLPQTGQPIANQWDVNVYMMNLLKERYKQ